jgi:uncharacterized membrane protein
MFNRAVIESHPLVTPAVRQIDIKAPFRWLSAGWQDFFSNPMASGFYGLAFLLAGLLVVTAIWQSNLLILTFVTGFFLLAPFLCLGLYDLSRQREITGSNHLWPSLFVFMRRRRDMALLVTFQAVVMIAWIRLVTLVSALYVSNTGTSVTVLFQNLLTSEQGLGFLGVFLLAGAALAALVFVTSVVAWPMLLHQSSGVLVAILTSVKAVIENKTVMLIWAGLIISLVVGIGIATAAIGLLVILPVIGHASWHAYRDLVE